MAQLKLTAEIFFGTLFIICLF